MAVSDIDNAAVKAALRRVGDAALNLDPLLRVIGEDLSVMIKETFGNSASPEGTPWAPNSEATIMALLDRSTGGFTRFSEKDGVIQQKQHKRSGGNFRKDGRISAKGAQRVMTKMPLIGETHALSTLIFYNVADGVLELGTPMEYGAMQHFGGTKAKFPHLWGDIPARPFMPITPEGNLMPVAETVVVDAVQEYLLSALEG